MVRSQSNNAEDIDGSRLERLTDIISSDTFKQWYREREFTRNIREGTPYFNGPGKVKPPSRHSPSSLIQCSRKIAYRDLNAPEETEDPTGIYWFGSRFEEDVAVPFLRQSVVDADEYVANSLWIDFCVSTDAGELRLKGETDPVIVDRDASPLLITEIKTKRSVENLEAPNKHHRAQVHAYMKGLSEKHGKNISQAVILYGGRKSFDIRAFNVEFDPWFWRNTVLDWAASYTTYRLNEELPPADPAFDWECEFCSYKTRCGQTDTDHIDTGPTGFLPLFREYPRQKVVEYIHAHAGAKLTPTLANEYPDLASLHGAFDWHCSVCGNTYDWNSVEWEEEISEPPLCPSCAEQEIPAPLSGPKPAEQHDLKTSDTDE